MITELPSLLFLCTILYGAMGLTCTKMSHEQIKELSKNEAQK